MALIMNLQKKNKRVILYKRGLKMDNGIFKFIRFLNESDYKMPTVELNAQKIYDTMYYNMPKS